MSRPSQRLLDIQERFDHLKEALKMTYGKQVSFAAGCAAWSQVIEYTICRYFDELRSDPSRQKEFEEEVRIMLQSYHEELCTHLDADLELVINTVLPHFREVLKDIVTPHGK